MTEFEKKLLLTKNEYDYLLKHYKQKASLVSKPIIKQINYYFDTDDLSMNRQNITCRIRLKDGKYKGTIKEHTSNTNASTETEICVRNGIHDNGFVDMGLTLKGSLVTHRCIIFKDSVCEAVLDRNEYLNYTDYELEIEYSPQFEHYAKQILNMINDCLMNCTSPYKSSNIMNRTHQVPSKSKRFFERYSLQERK